MTAKTMLTCDNCGDGIPEHEPPQFSVNIFRGKGKPGARLASGRLAQSQFCFIFRATTPGTKDDHLCAACWQKATEEAMEQIRNQILHNHEQGQKARKKEGRS